MRPPNYHFAKCCFTCAYSITDGNDSWFCNFYDEAPDQWEFLEGINWRLLHQVSQFGVCKNCMATWE